MPLAMKDPSFADAVVCTTNESERFLIEMETNSSGCPETESIIDPLIDPLSFVCALKVTELDRIRINIGINLSVK